MAVTDSAIQMRTVHRVRETLALATAALLISSTTQAAYDGVEAWQTSVGLLLYSEQDRVSAVEPVISARRNLDTDEYLNLKLTVDTLTGASATGAASSALAQTFTRPSGNGSYRVAAGETPLDDTFRDTRLTLDAGWQGPSRQDLTLNLGTSLSREYDYQSLGINGGLSRDAHTGNSTFSTGFSASVDSISPVGGQPIPFASMLPAGETQPRQGSGSDKLVVDTIFGVTQIINARSLAQINYAINHASGYLNDPYKFISIVDPLSGEPVFDNAAQPDLPAVAYENRPDTRTRHSLFARYKLALERSMLDGSYRFMVDDWGIQSNTLDLRYRIPTERGRYWQPHVRYYRQSAADFYTPFLLTDERPTAGDDTRFASADYRLSEFTGITLGLEYGHRGSGSGWSLAAEYYRQSGNEPAGKFGALNEQTLFPDVDIVYLRFVRDF